MNTTQIETDLFLALSFQLRKITGHKSAQSRTTGEGTENGQHPHFQQIRWTFGKKKKVGATNLTSTKNRNGISAWLVGGGGGRTRNMRRGAQN
jgi:hypothetical protein